VYGNQRHAMDLPLAPTKDVAMEEAVELPAEGKVVAKELVPLPARCGFLLGGE